MLVSRFIWHLMMKRKKEDEEKGKATIQIIYNSMKSGGNQKGKSKFPPLHLPNRQFYNGSVALNSLILNTGSLKISLS